MTLGECEEIVFWLRKQAEKCQGEFYKNTLPGQAPLWPAKEQSYLFAADAISRGDHLKESTHE